MAYVSGTAANQLDLHDRLVTFLTTGLGSQNWTLLGTDLTIASTKKSSFLRAPGNAGADQIYLTYYSYTDNTDFANASVRAATGYLAGVSFTGQPGDSGGHTLSLWNSAIPYWFVANGRRVIIVAKVSTVYQIAYAGFIQPYGTPDEFAYPCFVGACGSASASRRWSDTSNNHRAFWRGYNSAKLRTPGGNWRAVDAYSNSGSLLDANGATIRPWPLPDGMVRTQDNFSVMWPLSLCGTDSSEDGQAVYGELDGVFAVPGFGIASEDIITIGADNYLVVQDTFRTSNDGSYVAIKLS